MKYLVSAYHLEQSIDIKEVRTLFSDLNLIKREATLVFYKLKANSYLYVKDYGSVVFFNVSESDTNVYIQKIAGHQSVNLTKLPDEHYNVIVDDVIEVDFNTVKINYIDDDMAHIIMLNLSQSVALKDYSNRTSELYDETHIYTKQLEETGKVKLSNKEILKFIGKTMNFKNDITEHLFIFDIPELAWNNEELTKLDQLLKTELDVSKRYMSIQSSLDIIKENLDLLNNLVQHKYSSMLEWIIIILILFEILQVIFKNLF